MLRRWTIRSICIALLMLCLTTWVGSYYEYISVSSWNDTDYLQASLQGGRLYWSDVNHHPGGQPWWQVGYGRPGTIELAFTRSMYDPFKYQFLGFAWKHRTAMKGDLWLIIPLWFPTTFSAALLCLLWRKTRPMYNGKGFPIEPTTNPK